MYENKILINLYVVSMDNSFNKVVIDVNNFF